MQKTVIRSWYLISFHDASEPVEILWGIVVDDPSWRWRPGDYVRTSAVLEKRDGGVFITRNTEYHTQGEGVEASMSIADYPRLSNGFSPDDIAGMKELEQQGFKVTDS
jgi:hypothetical protein